MRGKYLPASKIKDDETRFCRSTFGVHYDRDLLPAPGSMMMEGLPDMALHWVHDEIRDGWEPNTKVVLGDLYDDAGAPLGLCPRGALRRAVADWGTYGLSPKVGIELGAFAFIHDDDEYSSPTIAAALLCKAPALSPIRAASTIKSGTWPISLGSSSI